MRHAAILVSLLASTAACSSSTTTTSSSTGGAPIGSGGQGGAQIGSGLSGGVPSAGGAAAGGMAGSAHPTASGGSGLGGKSATGLGGALPTGGASPGGAPTSGGTSPGGAPTGGSPANGGTTETGGGASSGGNAGSSPSGGTSAGGALNGGTAGAPTSSGGNDVGLGGGESGGAGAAGGPTDTGGQTDGGNSGKGGTPSACVGNAWPTADPTREGPFQVATDKNEGPLAGDLPDPIYGDEQQRFNVYRPENLADSGYCHPILIWANGYTDNPEPNPPLCVVDSGANKWCGQYLPMMKHLASHGFVVVASLSTATGRGDPLPTIVGLDWIIEQSEDPSSRYYHRLDTANIGQLGHSFGGMSTCMSASEPRYKALATICGTAALTGVHTPMLFFCGGRDGTVDCSGVKDTFLTVTDQPAFFINEKDADHGSWVYKGASGVSLSMSAAWFRVHLMGDTENRKYFYGSDCTFCTDNRVEVEQNSLMNE